MKSRVSVYHGPDLWAFRRVETSGEKPVRPSADVPADAWILFLADLAPSIALVKDTLGTGAV